MCKVDKKDRIINKILIGMAIVAAAILYGLVAHIEYTEARIGSNPCETYVRSCE